MFSATVSAAATPFRASRASRLPQSQDNAQATTRRIGEALSLIRDTLAPQRQIVREGDVICQAGQRFDSLYVLNSGCCKVVTLAGDGREQVVGLKFRGDWLGFDGIATGRYTCDTIAMDTGEIWVLRYQALLDACAAQPAAAARCVHSAMSREISQERDSLMSVCTLPADARVAEFLRSWADSLSERGLRTDQITLPLSRAEIGNYLGIDAGDGEPGAVQAGARQADRLCRAASPRSADPQRRGARRPSCSAAWRATLQ